MLLSLALILVIAAGTAFASGQAGAATGSAGAVDAYNLPRNQTLYYNGQQWGAPRGVNPYGFNSNNALASGGHRQLVFETLFVYDQMTNTLKPQIADSFSWSGQTLTVQLNRNVKFTSGAALTAADVVYSFNLAKTYTIGASGYWEYLQSVTAQGDYTVVFQAKTGADFNRLNVEQAISEFSITSRAYWEAKLASGDITTANNSLGAFAGWDASAAGTGPYRWYYGDDTKVVLIRNENYWGQHSSRYGKLPAPRYIAQNQYKDNASGDEALRRGEVDMSQQFTASIWTYFSAGVETYIPVAPYYIPGMIPSIIFNTQKPGLNDKAVRKALAMVIDYDQIGTTAMSGYTATKQASFMLPTESEQALINLPDLARYQWSAMDVAGANALLDQAGWVRGADGIRAKGGVRLSFRLECPYGWSDWNASLEIVAQAGRQIGMDLTTYFPEQPVWTDDMQSGNFDILMNNLGGMGISQPWSRARTAMGSTYLPPVGTPNSIGNWGRWVNARADQILALIPNETNAATLKALWTELNQIYLDEMPSIGLMYRPAFFYNASNVVWTNFPKLGSGIPPTILSDGYGIMGLYNIRLK
jgi:peptide/nickel transport system substrate-binding protein